MSRPVFLRPLEVSDLDNCVTWLNDPEVNQFIITGRFPIHREREREWLANLGKSEHDVVWAICLQEGGRHVGNCGLHKIEWVDRRAELGIAIGAKDCWGKGYGTHAVALMLDHGFHALGLNRIDLDVYAFNERARRSYAKVGFRDDGILRQRRFKNGAFQDVHVMSILRDEWKGWNA